MDSYRDDFPVTNDYAYFRHPAVAALPERTHDAIHRLTDEMTAKGCLNERDWNRRVEATREQAAELLSARTDRIGFVNSTSHGLSWVAESLPLEPGDEVLVPDCEFPANLFPWKNLQRKDVTVRTVPAPEGTFDPDQIDDLISSDTRVLSLSSVQFHTGFRADLETIGGICSEQDVFFVVDAIQSLGWESLDPDHLNIDALVADGHKWMCAPEGAGIIYLDEDFQEELHPAIVGWYSVESAYDFEDPKFDLRSDAGIVELGSRNTIGLIGLGESLSLLHEVGLKTIRRQVMELKEQLTRRLLTDGFRCRHTNWSEGNHSPILSLTHPKLPDDGVVEKCEERNVQLTKRGDRLRVGLHFYNNREDIDRLLAVLNGLVE